MTLSPSERELMQILIGRQLLGVLSPQEAKTLRGLVARAGPYATEAKQLEMDKLILLALGILAAWFILKRD